jgi:radical SAM superfamily enzyme YgiQ (UPF0313 family)
MIFGFPKETLTDIIHSYIFLAKVAWIGVDDVAIGTFIPYPGSEFFNELRNSKRIKTLDEEFFFELVAMGDAQCSPSFSENIDGRTLRACKLFGMIFFYSLSYIFRPRRFFETMLHLYNGNHKTRVEKALSSMISKLRLYKHIESTGNK